MGGLLTSPCVQAEETEPEPKQVKVLELGQDLAMHIDFTGFRGVDITWTKCDSETKSRDIDMHLLYERKSGDKRYHERMHLRSLVRVPDAHIEKYMDQFRAIKTNIMDEWRSMQKKEMPVAVEKS